MFVVTVSYYIFIVNLFLSRIIVGSEVFDMTTCEDLDVCYHDEVTCLHVILLNKKNPQQYADIFIWVNCSLYYNEGQIPSR